MRVFLCVWACVALQFGSVFVHAQDVAGELQRRLSRVHQNPAWDFVTEEFLETIEARQATLQGAQMTLLGVVKLPDGSPAVDACVILRVQSNNTFVSSIRFVDGVMTQTPQDVFAVAWTDDTGVFKFQRQPTPWTEPLRQLDWDLIILANECAMEIREYHVLDARSRIEDIQLNPARSVSGVLLDKHGEPVPNVNLSLVEVVNPYKNERGEFADIEFSLLFSQISMDAISDSAGSFSFTGLPANRLVSLTVDSARSSGFPFNLRVMTSPDMNEAAFTPEVHPRAALVHPHFQPKFAVNSLLEWSEIEESQKRMRRPAAASNVAGKPQVRKVTVRVVDEQTGKPVSAVGVRMQPGTIFEDSRLTIRLGDQATNENGEVEFECRPNSEYTIAASGRRFCYITHFERFTTSTTEYTPNVPAQQWIRWLDQGDDDIEVTFNVKPVAVAKVRVLDTYGKPVRAEVVITPADYPEDFYRLPSVQTDEDGKAEFSVRPVFFDVRLQANTDDDRTAAATFKLSRDLDVSDTVTLTVE